MDYTRVLLAPTLTGQKQRPILPYRTAIFLETMRRMASSQDRMGALPNRTSALIERAAWAGAVTLQLSRRSIEIVSGSHAKGLSSGDGGTITALLAHATEKLSQGVLGGSQRLTLGLFVRREPSSEKPPEPVPLPAPGVPKEPAPLAKDAP